MPSAAHLTVSFYFCSSESSAGDKLRALEGRCVSSKSSSEVPDGDEGVAGRNGREKYFPEKWSLICPKGRYQYLLPNLAPLCLLLCSLPGIHQPLAFVFIKIHLSSIYLHNVFISNMEVQQF